MSDSIQQKDFEKLISHMESVNRLSHDAEPGAKVIFQKKLTGIKKELLGFTRTTEHQDGSISRAPMPENEKERLRTLKALKVLDTPYEPLFDSITRLTAKICDKPIALISIVDEKRQWFKASYGLDEVRETPRDYSFCAHTILSNVIMEVADASKDPRFENNPLVNGNLDIRFYAGAPLLVTNGMSLGTLCVIDQRPGSLTNQQKDSLEGLAEVVVEALLLRHQLQNN